ncbi:MAG: cadherin domain-containing protein [Methylobacter sp.]|nr:cadherin domain-containing protein [Methylobacter sp.]
MQAGDTAADLDYSSTTALSLNGGTIVDSSTSLTAILTLATVGAANSLGANKDIVIDTTASATPGLALTIDGGDSNSDRTTTSGAVTVSGLQSGAAWEYSINGGGSWTAGSGSSFTLTGDGGKSAIVRQLDVAGNASANSTALTFNLDITAPSSVTGTLGVAENSANGTAGGTVSATDANSIDYSLMDNDSGRFAINANTGVISVADGSQLNYEANTSHAITVRATDVAGNSSDTVLAVTVIDVNEAPIGVGNLSLTAVNEDTVQPAGSAISALAGYVYQDADNGAIGSGVLVVGNGADAGTQGVWQYSSDGANWKAIGTVSDDTGALALASNTLLNFLPAADFNGIPTALTTRALDNTYSGGFSTTTGGTENRITANSIVNGGSAAIAAATNTIAAGINAVNDAPGFTKGANQTVNEDAGAQTIGNWATGLSKGPADESAQTLSFTTSNNNHALFSVQPTLDSNGNLSYTPAANANGAATITVSLTDSGGTANGGIDTSASQTFTITVNPINDLPTGVITISGTPSVGAILSVANTLADVDGLGAISYQWKAGGINITGATGSSYVLTAAEAGKTIAVVARYTDTQGTAESVSSTATTPVASAELTTVNLSQTTGNTDGRPSSAIDTGNGLRPDNSAGDNRTIGSGNSFSFSSDTADANDHSSPGSNGSGISPTLVVAMKLSVDSHGNGTSGGTLNLPSSAFAGLNTVEAITITATQSSGQSLPSWISVNPGTGAVTVKEGTVVAAPITVKVILRDSQGKQVVVLVKVQPKESKPQQQDQEQEENLQPDDGKKTQPAEEDNPPGSGPHQRSQLEQTAMRWAHAGKPGLTEQLQRMGSKGFESQCLKLLDSLASLTSNDKDAA